MWIKKQLGQFYRDFNLFRDFVDDFFRYRKYNFGNFKNKRQNALEARIMRQAHILEKGMSLSNPKLGFGQAKIQQLFAYLDEYIKKGYSQESDTFQTAIGALKAYVIYFKERGYVNDTLEKKINTYMSVDGIENNCGVENIAFDDIKFKCDFPGFFESRHSVRQFSEKEVSLDLIEKAIKLAVKSPSACNRQAAKVYMSLNPEINKTIGTLLEGNNGFADEVNKYLVITGDFMRFTDGYERNQCIIDASLFAMSLVLALHHYGVGSCILQASERKKLDKKRRKLLNIPENEKIVLFIAIGHYKDQFSVAKSKRNSLSDYLIVR